MDKFWHFIGYLFLAICVFGAIGFSCYQHSGSGNQKKVAMPRISNSAFMKDFKGRKIKSVDMMPKNRHHINVTGQLKNGRSFSSVATACQLGYCK